MLYNQYKPTMTWLYMIGIWVSSAALIMAAYMMAVYLGMIGIWQGCIFITIMLAIAVWHAFLSKDNLFRITRTTFSLSRKLERLR